MSLTIEESNAAINDFADRVQEHLSEWARTPRNKPRLGCCVGFYPMVDGEPDYAEPDYRFWVRFNSQKNPARVECLLEKFKPRGEPFPTRYTWDSVCEFSAGLKCCPEKFAGKMLKLAAKHIGE